MNWHDEYVMYRIAAPVLLGCLILLSGCSGGGEELSAETAVANGWEWPLTVDKGNVTCKRGVTGAEIAFTPQGSKTAYPLSPNALFAVNGGEVEYPGRLSSIRNGKPLKPFLDAAYPLCHLGGSPGSPPLAHDVEVMEQKG